MYKIKEAAERFQINPNVLRFYEKKKLIMPERDVNGYRLYSTEDIARIQMILLFRKMGFPLETITSILEKKSSPIDLFFQQFEAINHHIHTMSLIRDSMGKCIETMFSEGENVEIIGDQMKDTADLLSSMEQWVDRWDFNSWAEHYDEDVRKQRSGLDFYKNYDHVLDRTAEIVNEKTGSVVEIGIGTGELAKRILGKQKVIGIDQSVNMLKTAKRKFKELTVLPGSFLKLPLNDSSADTIVTSYAFHHCKGEEKMLALKEMDRVLKRDGRVIITDLMFRDEEAEMQFLETCTPEERRDFEDEYFARVDELEVLFHEMGYQCRAEAVDELIWIVVACLE
jgi:putative AdoMet-dependent methyltransferase